MRYLAARGADLKAKDAFGNTILTAAAIGNDLNTLRIALDAGVDVNTAGVTGITPLMLSAGYHANLPATKVLLAKGAKVNAVASSPTLFPLDDPKSGPIALHNFTPLLLAMPHASPEVVKTLLDAGADINAKDSPQHDAADVCGGDQPSESSGDPDADRPRRRSHRAEQRR